MKILTVIAARAGSKGIKNKNIRNLAGKPLILYTIEQVFRWGKFDKFIVSTDSDEIAKIAINNGVEVPFLRHPELASDSTGKMEVLRHALLETEKYFNMRFDALLDLDVTSPIRTVDDIEKSISLFKEKQPDCVFSVVKARRNPYFNMVEAKDDGTVVLCKTLPKEVKTRQQAPKVYEMNASIYVYKRDFLLDERNMLPYSKKAMIYEMGEFSAFDIDSELDFLFVEFLVNSRLLSLNK